jgi:hypothetical protein
MQARRDAMRRLAVILMCVGTLAAGVVWTAKAAERYVLEAGDVQRAAGSSEHPELVARTAGIRGVEMR